MSNLKDQNKYLINFVFYGILGRVIALIANFINPLVTFNIHGAMIKMRLSHRLFLITKVDKFYDTALPRICSFIKAETGHLSIIDVGANIGDTASIISSKVVGKILCVEANPVFFKLLKLNTENNSLIVCELAMIDDQENTKQIDVVEKGGNAYLKTGSGSVIKSITIDSLIKKYDQFEDTNIIKVDTEGFDYKVLRSAEKLLAQNQPSVFFELVPDFLISHNEDPFFIFDYFISLGYKSVLFYDKYGYPIMFTNLNEENVIKNLINYAKKKMDFYYDVLVFSPKIEINAESFYQTELNVFEDYNWK